MAVKFLSDEDRALIREMRNKGCTIDAVARAMSCSKTSVDRVLAEMGCVRKKDGWYLPWTAADDTIIRRMVGDGREAGAVADKLRRSVAEVRRRACDIGYPFPIMAEIAAPTRLHPSEARRNYEAIAAKLDAGLRARRNNVCAKTKAAEPYDPSKLRLGQKPVGRELNTWM